MKNIKTATTSLAILAAAMMFASGVSAQCVLNGQEVPGDPELIEGTSSADDINCSTSPTRHDIYGYGGNDTIRGSAFDDFIAGGSNNDTIYDGDGNDAIDGGAKDDFLYGEGGDDVIFGGAGSSSAAGVSCELQTKKYDSWDKKGGSGDDYIEGGAGDDCIYAGSGEDVVYGEDGNDTILGGNHKDTLNGGADDDYIDGGGHSDTCDGGGGNDILISC